jgi:hypothetical protein
LAIVLYRQQKGQFNTYVAENKIKSVAISSFVGIVSAFAWWLIVFGLLLFWAQAMVQTGSPREIGINDMVEIAQVTETQEFKEYDKALSSNIMPQEQAPMMQPFYEKVKEDPLQGPEVSLNFAVTLLEPVDTNRGSK